MKPRPWILAVVAVSLLTTSLLAVGGSRLRPSRPADAARSKSLAPADRATDAFASKKRVLPAEKSAAVSGEQTDHVPWTSVRGSPATVFFTVKSRTC